MVDDAPANTSCASCREELAGRAPIADVAPSDVAATQRAASGRNGDAAAPRAGGGATALLERPSGASGEHPQIRYRSRARRRKVIRVLVVFVALGAGVVALVAFDARADGPLTEQLVRLGVLGEPVVSVPDAWSTIELGESAGGSVQVEAALPNERYPVTAALPAPAPPGAQLAGAEATLGTLGTTAALSSDLGGAAAAFDGDAGLGSLADAIVATVPGQELSRSTAMIGEGRALDVVVVATGVEGVARFGSPPPPDAAADAGSTAGTDPSPAAGAPDAEPPGVTTRLRVMLVADQLVALVTSGVDDGADRLDDAHRRLVESFSVEL